ncbi:hypothetical protein KUCAC02_036485, partial [Chaenocephalus aceratus]
NPLLLNSSVPPDLTSGRSFRTPLCFHDAANKDLFDPLPDIKVKVQSSSPRDSNQDYSDTEERHKKGLLNGPARRRETAESQRSVRAHRRPPGVSLLVPRGAVAEDESCEMFMVINDGEARDPEESRAADYMRGKRDSEVRDVVEDPGGLEILLGPEVTYGPPGLALSVPLALNHRSLRRARPGELERLAEGGRPGQGKWEVRAGMLYTRP